MKVSTFRLLASVGIVALSNAVVPCAFAYGDATAATSEAIAPPATQLATTTLVAPATAGTYYGSSLTHTNGLSIGATNPPEIVALADAIRAGREVSTAGGRDAFAQDVADYVRNNIRTEFKYGLSKGGRGALIDQSGTPFDQAELMVMLLRQEGVTANFVVGSATLTAAQFGKWAGLFQNLNEGTQSFTTLAKAACQMLADGGMPAVVNGSSDCTSLSGDLSSVAVSHIWVQVGSTSYDPSYKEYLLRNGIDVPAAMGCGTASASTCGSSMSSAGMTGASSGTDNGIPYVENYNYGSATSLQNGRTDSLSSYIKTSNINGQATNASVFDVLGGKKLVAQSLAAAPLSYSASATWTGSIPDQYRTKLTLWAGSTCASFFGDEIAGSALVYTRNVETGVGFQVDGTSLPSLSYVAAVSCSATTVPYIRMAVDHPYAAASGAYADQTVDFKTVDPPSDETGFMRRSQPFYLYKEGGAGVTPRSYAYDGSGITQRATDWPEQNYLSFGPITIIHGFGQSGMSAQKYFSDRNAVLAPSETRCSITTTTILLYRQCNYADHAVIAGSFNSMRTLADDLVDGLNKTISVRHHDMGIVYPGRAPGLAFMSIQETISVAPATGAATDRKSAFDQAALVLAEVESRANAIDSSQGVSASRAFFNSYSLGTRIYDIVPAKMATYTANLPTQDYATVGGAARAGHFCLNYIGYTGAATGQPTACWRHLALNDVANAGFSILMREGGIGELAYNGDNSEAFTTWEYVKGGATVPDGYSAAMKTTEIVDPAALRRKFLSVSAGTGDFHFTAGSDIVSGAGDFPYSLPFIRTYTPRPTESTRSTSNWYYTTSGGGSASKISTSSVNFGPDALYHDRLGGAWGHNYQILSQRSNDLAYQLGAENALFATELISSLQVIKDLKLNGSLGDKITSIAAISNIQRTIPGYAGGTYNTLIVRRAEKATSFHLMRDGSWRSSEEPGATITSDGATYTSADGEVISFSPYRYDATFLDPSTNALQGTPSSYTEYRLMKADSWTFPNGMRLDFTYTAMPLSFFDGCNTGLKPDYYLGNYGYRLASVRNNLGRQLNFTYSSTTVQRQYTELGCKPAVGDTLWAPAGPGTGHNITYLLTGVSDENGRSISFSTDGTINTNIFSVTDTLSNVTRYEYTPGMDSPAPATLVRNGYQLRRWFVPSSGSSAWQSIRFDGLNRVSQITDRKGNVLSYYPSGLFGSEFWKRSRVIDGVGNLTLEDFNDRNGNIRSVDGVGNITLRRFDNSAHLLRVQQPLGGAVEHLYDFRGNELQTCLISSARAGQSCNPSLDIVTSTSYGEAYNVLDCVNRIICNKPATDTDARGNVTTYSWNATTGDLTAIQKPPVYSVADGANVSPTTTVTYTTLNGISFLTRKSEAISATQSVKTSYDYDASNHYALRSVIVDDDGLALRTCLKFDAIGNLLSKTDPNANLSVCP